MRVRLGDVRPNPFRNIDRLPYRPDKLEALRESIRATGFWDNLVARMGAEGPEIAYGHHRLKVLNEERPPEWEIDLNIRELSDDDMMKIMARENMTEWGTSAVVEMETVRAVVQGYGAGRIHLGEIPETATQAQTRYAPSFVLDAAQLTGQHPYTAQLVAAYVGWLRPDGRAKSKVHDIFGALELIEEGVLSDSDYDGLSTTQAQTVTARARAARDEARARAREAEEAARAAAAEAAAAGQQQAAAQARRAEAEVHPEAPGQSRTEYERERARRATEQADREWKEASARREAAEQRQREQEERAAQARATAVQQAAEAARAAGQQMREGASTRDARESGQALNGQSAELDKIAVSAAAVMREFLGDPRSDLVKFLAQVNDRADAVSLQTRNDLADALAELSDQAIMYRSRVLAASMAGAEFAGAPAG